MPRYTYKRKVVRGANKAMYHKENGDYRVVLRGTLYYAQRRTSTKPDQENHGWTDLHRGTDHDTAHNQMGAAVASAKVKA